VHLRISKCDKQEIASKLLQGVNIDDILSSYKEDGLSKQTKRKHLIKRRDILNISKKYNVNITLPKVHPSKNKTKYELVQEAVEPIVMDSIPNTIEANKKHFISSQLALSFVRQIHENVWRISLGNALVSTFSSNNYDQEVYVTKNDVISCSTNDCNSYCNYCNICYHVYSCTCSDFLSKKIICEHVHLTVIFQSNPETFRNEDHRERCLYGNQDHTKYTQNSTEAPNSQQPINIKNKDHTEYTQNFTEPPNSQQPITIKNEDHTKYTRNCTESSISQQYIKNFKLYNHSENTEM